MIQCKNCGNSVEGDCNFCPNCGSSMGFPSARLSAPEFTRTPQLITAGILILLSSLFCVYASFRMLYLLDDTWFSLVVLTIIIMQFYGFALGLFTTTFVFKGEHYRLVLFNSFFVMAAVGFGLIITILGLIPLLMIIAGIVLLRRSGMELILPEIHFRRYPTPSPKYRPNMLQDRKPEPPLMTRQLNSMRLLKE